MPDEGRRLSRLASKFWAEAGRQTVNDRTQEGHHGEMGRPSPDFSGGTGQTRPPDNNLKSLSIIGAYFFCRNCSTRIYDLGTALDHSCD